MAETSLTIEGVRLVIDCGLERKAIYNSKTEMNELVTQTASRASAEQRAGRAGRQQAGVCYRLWSQDGHHTRPAFSAPDITSQDVSQLALSLASWGSLDLDDYLLLDKPNLTRWQQSLDLLRQLNALEHSKITEHGSQLSKLGTHPRLGHMLLVATSQSSEQAVLACQIAAVLSEGSPLRFEYANSDIREPLELINTPAIPKRFHGAQVNSAKAQRIVKLSKKWLKQLSVKDSALSAPAIADAGHLLMLAYPDRMAQHRETLPSSRSKSGYRLRSGQGAQCLDGDPVEKNHWLAIADLTSSKNQTNIIRLAAPVSLQEIQTQLQSQIRTKRNVIFNEKGQANGVEQTKLGDLILSQRPF